MNKFSTLPMLQLFLVLILCSIESFSFAQTDSFLQCLSTKISNEVLANITYKPKTANYTTVLYQYSRNARFDTSTYHDPMVIIAPYEESQFQDVVNCAKKVGLQLRIRSGGHDYEGLSYTSKTSFAILDLFNYKSIDINIDDEMAWVQAGATLGELYYNIWNKSKVHAFPAGVCPTVGVGGHISGGGYGNMLRNFGLSVDNVIDAKIVDAKGRVLDRKGMGEDLFWAIRGGGGASFGVILAYKIKLVRVPPLVTVFNVQRKLHENATNLVYQWQYIADKLENDLFIRTYIQPVDPKKNGHFTIQASFIAMFLGDANRLVSILQQKFPELGVKKEDCTEMPWIKSVMFWDYIPDGTPETVLLNRTSTKNSYKHKSDYVKTPIPKHVLEGAFKRIIKSGKLEMMFNPYGGRMSEIPSSETAFPHRAGNIFKIQYLLYWNHTGDDAIKRHIHTARDIYSYMRPYVSKNPREAFLNYRDLDIGSTHHIGPNAYKDGKVYGHKFFKDNFDRLVKVKTEVDPENFFRYEQSIPVLRV